MKKITYLISVFIIFFIFASCGYKEDGATSSVSDMSRLYRPPFSGFGYIMWEDYPTFNVATLGPNNIGYKTLILGYSFNTKNMQDYTNARNNNYNPIVTHLWRESLEGDNPNLHDILIAMESVKPLGAEWVYIDDLLTKKLVNEKTISKQTIDAICTKARSLNMKVAVSEECKTVFTPSPKPINNNWDLYANVDIIMPYGYNCSLSELREFYSWISSKGKDVVPILGYNAGVNGTKYFQKGANSGHTGYIELAKEYSNIIFYYIEPAHDISVLNGLTNYLQQNNYLPLLP